MIRTILAASVLCAGTAHATDEKKEIDPAQNLAFCGSQVATLAWFYKGAVEDGSPELQPELDGLLAMQSIFIGQIEQLGTDTIDLFKRMTKRSINELATDIQGPRDQGALALAHVNTNVRGCADIYFEKIDEPAQQSND